ncbi:15379_t:CDS:2, partial [Gigaspora margarita]
QKALTDSLSLNASGADDTEATYEKGGSLDQSKLTENSFLSSSRRLEDLINNSDKAAEIIKKSGDSRKTNSKGEESENLQEKEQEIIKKNTNKAIVQKQYQTMQCEIMQAKTQSLIETMQNNSKEDQEISNKIEAGFTIVTYKKRNTRFATEIGSSNKRHIPYKKDKRG